MKKKRFAVVVEEVEADTRWPNQDAGSTRPRQINLRPIKA
ncbi:hypothetical protein SAMN05216332_11072 [Nitrosospira briensis]|nr:hypothetical protein SAMN05216332_11072 [Nitrosospira briensis]